MTQQPPPFDPSDAPQGNEISPGDFGRAPAAKGNPPAVVSLVTALIGCLGITAIVAVITGIIGIKRANRSGGSGKGMALAGTILGAVWLLIWVFVVPAGGLGIFWAMKGVEAPRQLANDFVRDLANNDIDAALTKVQPGSILSRARLEAISEEMDTLPGDTGPSDWGRFKELSGTNISINSVAGVSTFNYSGTAEFDNVVKGFEVAEVKEGEEWKITSFEFTD